MPYNEAAEYFEKIHSIDAREFYKNLSVNAGRAFTISWVNSIETLEDIRKEFAKQTKDHLDPEELKKFIQDVIASRGEDPLHPSHLANVVRTNVQTAFSKGRIEAQIELSKEYWQYFAVLDGRETELCHTLDGKVFKSTDPFWKKYYPPNHYQCRSTVVALDEDELEDTPEEDGQKYLESSDLKDIEPGRGFQYSPLNALDKHLDDKKVEHKIENKTVTPPVGKTPLFKKYTEAEAYLKNKYPKTIFDLKGIDVKILNEWAESFDRFMNEFEIKELDYFGTLTAPYSQDPYLKNTWRKGDVAATMRRMNRRTGEFKQSVIFKRSLFSKYDETMKDIIYHSSINWSPKNVSSISSTLYHEFGHLIDHNLKQKLSHDKRIIDIFKNNRYNISRYGGSSVEEFIAEAFCDVMCGDSPCDTSKEVFELIKNIWNDNK